MRSRTRFHALSAACALPLFLATCAVPVSAQAPPARSVHITVTDPRGRFVTGLEQRVFDVVENGVRRPIAGFTDVDSPVALAIVAETPLAESFSRPGDDLIQTRSLSEALRRLAASKNTRKIVVVTDASDTQSIPAGLELVRTDPASLSKMVVELRNQYVLSFESAGPATGVEVQLRQPRGLPPLKVNLSEPRPWFPDGFSTPATTRI